MPSGKSLDHLVRPQQQRRLDREAKRLRRTNSTFVGGSTGRKREEGREARAR